MGRKRRERPRDRKGERGADTLRGSFHALLGPQRVAVSVSLCQRSWGCPPSREEGPSAGRESVQGEAAGEETRQAEERPGMGPAWAALQERLQTDAACLSLATKDAGGLAPPAKRADCRGLRERSVRPPQRQQESFVGDQGERESEACQPCAQSGMPTGHADAPLGEVAQDSHDGRAL